MEEGKSTVFDLKENFKINKAGKPYEELVGVLSRYLHKNAIITCNDKIADITTGQKRQIDISIRIKDGPTNFLAIIEARDRSRKVGVDYIEQIKSKRDSVRADKAIVVSNKGFAKTAIKKAGHYGIETYSLAEALRKDWSNSFKYFQAFTQSGYEGSHIITFLDKNMNAIHPHKSLNEMIEKDKNALVLYDKEGNPKYNLEYLMQQIYNLDGIKNLVHSDLQKKHTYRVVVSVPEEVNIFFLNEQGKLQRLEQYEASGEIGWVMREYKPTVKQYKDEKTGQLIAEVLGTDDSSFMFELLHNKETGAVSLREKK